MTDRVLFISSNGTGLGHLTRSMAIARRLPDRLEPLFVTLSAGAPVVRGLGFPVEYVASYATPGSGNDWRWSRRLRARLAAAIAEADPALCVFDGTHPYEALLGALRGSGAAKVWCRRGLWKQGSDRAPLARTGAFDAVLEPGDLAGSEDRGPTAPRRGEAYLVPPIVLLDREELLPRSDAERELGLEAGQTNVLVTLGQGDEVRAATDACLRNLAGRPGVQVVAASSALAGLGEVPAGVKRLEATYPISRYYAAFDGAVAAPGYNAFHELVYLGVPSLFVPMRRQTDDQPARARVADEAGIGLGLAGPTDHRLPTRLDALLDPALRDRIRTRLADLPLENGAQAAAEWLAELAELDRPGRGRPGASLGQALGWRARDRASSARPPRSMETHRRWRQFIRYAPRTAWRLARQTLTQPRPRTLVLALGLRGDDLEAAVRDAITDAGEEPRRTLVVTDSLGLGRLLALGVGVEHIPAEGERQPELAGSDYDEFARRRLELILAERPRPRRVLTAAGSSPLAERLSAWIA